MASAVQAQVASTVEQVDKLSKRVDAFPPKISDQLEKCFQAECKIIAKEAREIVQELFQAPQDTIAQEHEDMAMGSPLKKEEQEPLADEGVGGNATQPELADEADLDQSEEDNDTLHNHEIFDPLKDMHSQIPHL